MISLQRSCLKISNKNSGNWIGVGAAMGAIVFALTREPVWMAIGVAISVGLDWSSRKNN